MTSNINRSSLLDLTCGIALLLTPIVASAQAMPPAVTEHTLKLGSTLLKYKAIFNEKVLNDASGAPTATLSSIAYVRSDVKVGAKRPVMFLFNGGPGASSALLHLLGFGPRVLATGKTPALKDNPNTLLDAADLVFIDPPGTGLNRILKSKGAGRFLGMNGDTAAVLGLINSWLKTNHRESSPLYLVGESYGGTRAALIAGRLADQKSKLNVKGLLLISPALDYSAIGLVGNNDTSSVMHFPSMAAGAWYYNKINRQGRSISTFFAQAQAFANKEYAPALRKKSKLTQAERNRLAEKMATFIGMDPAIIRKANLRIDPTYYLSYLNGKKHLMTERLDMRITTRRGSFFNLIPPAVSDDPTVGIGAGKDILASSMTSYLHDELKVPGTQKYVSLSFDVNLRWNWLDISNDKYAGEPRYLEFNVTPDIAKLMKRKPDVKLMVVGGYYDLSVPLWANHYAIERAHIPRNRVQFYDFPSGHTVFKASEDLSSRISLLRTYFNLK